VAYWWLADATWGFDNEAGARRSQFEDTLSGLAVVEAIVLPLQAPEAGLVLLIEGVGVDEECHAVVHGHTLAIAPAVERHRLYEALGLHQHS
jgi:hypothetical protein